MTREEAVKEVGEELVSLAESNEKIFTPKRADYMCDFLFYESVAKTRKYFIRVVYRQPFFVVENHPDKASLKWKGLDYEVKQVHGCNIVQMRKLTNMSMRIPHELFEFYRVESLRQGLVFGTFIARILSEYKSKIQENRINETH